MTREEFIERLRIDAQTHEWFLTTPLELGDARVLRRAPVAKDGGYLLRRVDLLDDGEGGHLCACPITAVEGIGRPAVNASTSANSIGLNAGDAMAIVTAADGRNDDLGLRDTLRRVALKREE